MPPSPLQGPRIGDRILDRADPNFHDAQLDPIVAGVAAGADGARVGVFGASHDNYGVWAHSTQATGLYAAGAQLAARLDGDVEVTGKSRWPATCTSPTPTVPRTSTSPQPWSPAP